METVLETDEGQSLSLAQEMQQVIYSLKVKPKIRKDSIMVLQKEFNLYEVTGTRTKNLDLLFNALCTTQPTSTASERVFSIAGIFSTKLRSRLQFKTLNALIFLKYYFLKENK